MQVNGRPALLREIITEMERAVGAGGGVGFFDESKSGNSGVKDRYVLWGRKAIGVPREVGVGKGPQHSVLPVKNEVIRLS